MSDVDAEQVSGTVGASQPGGTVAASQVGGTVGARLAQPAANLWTPAELDGLALWLDVWDSDFDLRTDGGTDYVERWGDLSGNGNDATQATGSLQPVLTDEVVDFTTNNNMRLVESKAEWAFALGTFTQNSFFSLAGNESFLRLKDGECVTVYEKRNVDVGCPTGKDMYAVDLVDRTALRTNGSLFNEGPGGIPIGIGRKSELNNSSRSRGDSEFTAFLYGTGDPDLQLLEGWAAHKGARNGIPEPLANLPASHPYKDEPPRG
jgi:hypothetical protein